MSLQHRFRRILSGESLNDRLKAADGRPSGFDYMRLGLALAIIGYHSIETSYGFQAHLEILKTSWRPLVAIIVPMFFALSGFLIASSLERSRTLISFMGCRVLRIVPALAVEVLVSACLLGPLLTTLPIDAYIADQTFAAYFLNIAGDIHYNLPGVFSDNPNPNTVNGQLWTIPSELACYVLLALLALFGIFKRRAWLLAFLAAGHAAQIGKIIFDLQATSEPGIDGGIHGRTLAMIFVAGMLLYRYRDKIPYHGGLFALSCVVSFALMACPPHGDRLVAVPLAYMTAYLGLLNPPRHKLLLSGDYSYGLYLYGYPLQQAIASFGPALRHWHWNLLLAIPCTAIIAAGSWWLVEKPTLDLRIYLKRLEERYLAQRARIAASLARGFARRIKTPWKETSWTTVISTPLIPRQKTR